MKDSTIRRQSALHTLLDQMEVPEMRKDASSVSNLRWLSRNLAVQNHDHPMFETTINLVVWMLRHGVQS